MMNFYKLPQGKSLYGMATQISTHLKKKEGMEVQTLTADKGEVIVQGKKIGLADAMCGVQRAVTVRIVSAGEGVAIVDVGEGKWWDKAFGVVFGAVGFWPIIGLAAYGSCRQAAVPGRVHRCIKKYLKETNALEEA